MHADVTRRHDGHAVLQRHLVDAEAVAFVERALQQHEAQPRASRERGRHPRRLIVQTVDVGRVPDGVCGKKDQQAVGQALQVRPLRRRRREFSRMQQ